MIAYTYLVSIDLQQTGQNTAKMHRIILQHESPPSCTIWDEGRNDTIPPDIGVCPRLLFLDDTTLVMSLIANRDGFSINDSPNFARSLTGHTSEIEYGIRRSFLAKPSIIRTHFVNVKSPHIYFDSRHIERRKFSPNFRNQIQWWLSICTLSLFSSPHLNKRIERFLSPSLQVVQDLWCPHSRQPLLLYHQIKKVYKQRKKRSLKAHFGQENV